jgi:DNA-binding LacI/PurR family transcriptional regulator
MSSLASIAKATGLAVTTVSEVLRGKPGYSAATRTKVQEAAQKLSYRPNNAARQLRGGRSGMIAALIGQDNPQANFDRLAALESVAYEARGWRLLVGQIHHADEKLGDYLLDLASRGVDGLFWMNQPFASGGEEKIPGIVSRFGGIVSLDHAVAANAGCVRIDYGAGITQAVAALAAGGRKKIGIALAAAGVKGDPLHARMTGYKRGLKDAGLEFSEARTWIGNGSQTPSPEQLDEILRKLVRTAKCDAILASNDIWAAELLRAIRRAGLSVPKDVAVVGFDNLSFAGLCDPALTTIDQQHEAFATAAVNLMEQILAGKGAQLREVVIEPKLIVRESA